jgi:hypothetical protein
VPVTCPTRRAACPIVVPGFGTVRKVKSVVAICMVTVAVASAVAGCGSSDSTASKTPGPTAPNVSAPPPAGAPVPSGGVAAPAAEAEPCDVNLAAPEIAKAVSELPRDPRSNQGWSPEPLAGNYNECAPLSVVIVKANTNAENPNTRAVMFHLGQFIPAGVPDTYGFNGIDNAVSTGDTVALRYSNGVSGLDSVVRFRWNGNGVELIGNTG